MRVMADWASALLFRPDIVKIDPAREAALRLWGDAAGAAPADRSRQQVGGPPPVEERV